MTLEEALWQDDERMSGAVCFRGTRIPVYIFIDHLKYDEQEEFLEGYPDVTKEQVTAVLDGFQMLLNKHFNVPVWPHELESQEAR